MHINADLLCLTNINGSFDTISEESSKLIESEEERNWIGNALTDINNPEKGTKLLERISHQVDTLSSFTPDQIIRLVNFLMQSLKPEPDSQKTTNYLCQQVAALIIEKNVHSYENFLKQTREKKFAIQVLIQLVRKNKLSPLDARRGIYENPERGFI